MLIDRIKIKIKAGDGGKGLISFDNRQKAYGGNGGKGGDVVLVGDENVYDLSSFNSSSHYRAENGQIGSTHRRNGRDGEDLRLKVPLVTRVLDIDDRELALIQTDGQEVKMLKGAQGGLGNYSLRGTNREGKYSRKREEKGEDMIIKLELNLKSDAILLGYPNAGKSSVINALTRTKAKVASYEFTTLEPQVGIMDGYIRLMDLPGLIEGTHKGKGLGNRFLKHTKYSKLLIHCISIDSDDLVKRYRSMREEFKKISTTLDEMEELVLLTKADIFTPEKSEEIREKLEKKIDKKVISVSTYLEDTLLELKEEIKSRLDSLQN